jgi:hypothetical protein
VFGYLYLGAWLCLRRTCKALRAVADEYVYTYMRHTMNITIYLSSRFPVEQYGNGIRWFGKPEREWFLYCREFGGSVPFVGRFDTIKSGIIFWMSGLKQIYIFGNDADSTSFHKMFNRILRMPERVKKNPPTFSVVFDPYLAVNSQNEKLVERINTSQADFHVELTITDSFSPSLPQEKIGLGEKFQKMTFRMKDSFNPAQNFQFTEQPLNLEVTLTSLSQDGECLGTYDIPLNTLPGLFAPDVYVSALTLTAIKFGKPTETGFGSGLDVGSMLIKDCSFPPGSVAIRDSLNVRSLKVHGPSPGVFGYFDITGLEDLEVKSQSFNVSDLSFLKTSCQTLQHVWCPIRQSNMESALSELQTATNLETLTLCSGEVNNMSQFVQNLVSTCAKLRSVYFVNETGPLNSTAFKSPDWQPTAYSCTEPIHPYENYEWARRA